MGIEKIAAGMSLGPVKAEHLRGFLSAKTSEKIAEGVWSFSGFGETLASALEQGAAKFCEENQIDVWLRDGQAPETDALFLEVSALMPVFDDDSAGMRFALKNLKRQWQKRGLPVIVCDPEYLLSAQELDKKLPGWGSLLAKKSPSMLLEEKKGLGAPSRVAGVTGLDHWRWNGAWDKVILLNERAKGFGAVKFNSVGALEYLI